MTVDFERFTEATYSKVRRTAVMLCRSGPDAEDATQESFAAMHRRWSIIVEQAGRLKVEGRISDVHRYLEGYAVTSMKNALRKAARKNRRSVSVTAELMEIIAPVASPRASAEFVEIVEMLHRLPPRQREVVFLRCLLELSTAETVQVLGLPALTGTWIVNSSLHRARQKLAQLLGLTYRKGATFGDSLVGGAASDPLLVRLTTAYALLLRAYEAERGVIREC